MFLLPAPRTNWLLPAGDTLPDVSPEGARLLQSAVDSPVEYFPVHRAYQDVVDELVGLGCLVKSPDSAKRTWYGLTAYGHRVGQRLRSKVQGPTRAQRALAAARFERFEQIRQEMLDEGYYILPEPGRGWEFGQVGFFSTRTGRKTLLISKLGKPQWEEHERGYYKPVWDDQPVAVNVPVIDAAYLAAIPF